MFQIGIVIIYAGLEDNRRFIHCDDLILVIEEQKSHKKNLLNDVAQFAELGTAQ